MSLRLYAVFVAATLASVGLILAWPRPEPTAQGGAVGGLRERLLGKSEAEVVETMGEPRYCNDFRGNIVYHYPYRDDKTLMVEFKDNKAIHVYLWNRLQIVEVSDDEPE